MLTKKVALVCLTACLGMGKAQCVELVGTGGRGMAVVAAAAQSAAPAPVPNPYCLLLIGLGMLGFSSRGQRNEVFARDP
jgi:hypothetical protein